MNFKYRRGGSWNTAVPKRRMGGEWHSGTSPASTPFDGDGAGFDEEAGFTDKQWFYDAAANGDLEVVKVTNLDSEGTGSYEWAVNYSSDPTLVVFEVAGVIDYGSESSWAMPRTDNTYVAGQTAPSPGITIIRSGLSADANNAVHEHYRVRPGNDVGRPDNVEATDLEDPQENVIINHMTLAWATDNNVSHKEDVEVTWANNIIGESLYESDHNGSPGHNYGWNSKEDDEICGFGNFLMSHRRRNPRVHRRNDLLWVNNFSYNTGRYISFRQSSVDDEDRSTVVAIGNHYDHGNEDRYRSREPYVRFPVDLYFEDNISTPIEKDEIADPDSIIFDSPPFMVDFEPLPSNEVKDFVLQSAGARPADVDTNGNRVRPEDQRMIDWAQEGGGHPWIGINSPEYEYPDYDPVHRSLNPPSDTSQILEWLQQYTNEVELGTDNPLH